MSKINVFNSDNFSVVFSNIPIPETSVIRPSLRTFNNFVKAIVLPDYNLEILESTFGNIVRKNPVSRINNDFTQISIDFRCDEDLTNYMTFYTWIKELREGRPTKDSGGKLHKSNIAAIQVSIKDNEKRERQRMRFSECQIISLSSLVLSYGINDEVTFTVTMNYNNFEIIKSTLNVNN